VLAIRPNWEVHGKLAALIGLARSSARMMLVMAGIAGQAGNRPGRVCRYTDFSLVGQNSTCPPLYARDFSNLVPLLRVAAGMPRNRPEMTQDFVRGAGC